MNFRYVELQNPDALYPCNGSCDAEEEEGEPFPSAEGDEGLKCQIWCCMSRRLQKSRRQL